MSGFTKVKLASTILPFVSNTQLTGPMCRTSILLYSTEPLIHLIHGDKYLKINCALTLINISVGIVNRIEHCDAYLWCLTKMLTQLLLYNNPDYDNTNTNVYYYIPLLQCAIIYRWLYVISVFIYERFFQNKKIHKKIITLINTIVVTFTLCCGSNSFHELLPL